MRAKSHAKNDSAVSGIASGQRAAPASGRASRASTWNTGSLKVVLALTLAWMAALPAIGEEPAEVTPSAELTVQLAEIREQLELLRREADRPSDGGVEALAGPIGPTEEIMARTERALEQHIEALSQIQSIARQRDAFARTIEEETAEIRQSAPLPIDEVDRLWARAASRFRSVAAARSLTELVAAQEEDARTVLDAEMQRRRQLTDEIKLARQRASGVQETLQALSLADLRVRESRTTLDALEAQHVSAQTRQGFALLRAERTRDLAELAARLSPIDQETLDDKLAAVAQDTAATRTRIRDLTEQLGARERDLSAAMSAPAGQEPASVQEAWQDAARAKVTLSELALRRERSILLSLEAQSELWKLRFQLQTDRSQPVQNEAMTELNGTRALIDSLRELATTEMRSVQEQLNTLNERLDNRTADPARPAWIDHRGSLRRMRDVYGDFDRWAADQETWLTVVGYHFDLLVSATTLLDRLQDLLAWSTRVFLNFWNYELFTVEETIEVDGQTITGKLGITVWKVVSALLIATLGIWLAILFGGLLRRIMLLRGASETTATLGYRIFNILLVFMLVVTALSMVNIPFTTFSFLGGALAIGVGFGAQNLVNNFISGIILLLERPIEIGDVIEVDGIRGTVRKVGARFSQIRRFDGVDMLLPNSLLLEQKVTNLTLDDQNVRADLTVGVAYGSSTRETSQIILAAAEEHGLVLKDPKPFVVFAEFGESALVFTLYFWVAMEASTNWIVVASDLRHMIDRSLREAGITIAFPQRDVHLDMNGSIAVKLESHSQSAQA
ncbi:MAG: mechanosensitive ion channel [Pseudomonadales bacterium]